TQCTVCTAVIDKQECHVVRWTSKILKATRVKPLSFIVTGNDDNCSCHYLSYVMLMRYAELMGLSGKFPIHAITRPFESMRIGRERLQEVFCGKCRRG